MAAVMLHNANDLSVQRKLWSPQRKSLLLLLLLLSGVGGTRSMRGWFQNTKLREQEVCMYAPELGNILYYTSPWLLEEVCKYTFELCNWAFRKYASIKFGGNLQPLILYFTKTHIPELVPLGQEL